MRGDLSEEEQLDGNIGVDGFGDQQEDRNSGEQGDKISGEQEDGSGEEQGDGKGEIDQNNVERLGEGSGEEEGDVCG